MNAHPRSLRIAVPAALLVVAGVVTGFLARSDKPAAFESTPGGTPVLALAAADGRYTPFETGEIVPFEPEPTAPAPAPVAKPKAEDWSRLSNHTVASVATTNPAADRVVNLPAPAGFDTSLDALERSRLIAARSVENEAHRVASSGPGFRIDMSNVCIPGVDE